MVKKTGNTLNITAISLGNLVLLFWILVASTFIFGTLRTSLASSPPIEQARELVSIGMSRDKTIELLSADAWYHQPCQESYPNVATDLFFYNSHRYDKADIVVVHYLLSENGEFQVSSIITCRPPCWQSLFEASIDRTQFEN